MTRAVVNRLAALLLGLLLANSAIAETLPLLRIAVASDVYSDYRAFVGKRDPLRISTFNGAHARRDVVEVVLLQQALQRGGLQRPLQFVLTESDGRTLKLLAQGEADVSGSSSWKSSAEVNPSRLSASRALIAQGHFVAGLYFPEGHPALQEIAAQPSALKRYTAVCADDWEPDLVTLKALGSPVLPAENWQSMLGMLRKKRGDYLLAPFQPTPDFHLQAGGLTLLPVPGVKVSLAGSRHFILSRSVQGSSAVETALNRGLQLLEQDGTLRRAYQESGAEDPRVGNWKSLN